MRKTSNEALCSPFIADVLVQSNTNISPSRHRADVGKSKREANIPMSGHRGWADAGKYPSRLPYYSLLPQSHTCMSAVAYLVSCFSHHLLASGPPNCRHGDDPVKVSGFHCATGKLELTDELVLEILEDVSNDVNEVVLLAIACGDLHVPVY